jgi:hypothetical protein
MIYVLGYACGIAALLALIYAMSYVASAAWVRVNRRPRPTPNPLQPDHMICGDVHCDPCNRADRMPPTACSHMHSAGVSTPYLAGYCRESCTDCMYPDSPIPCPHQKWNSRRA